MTSLLGPAATVAACLLAASSLATAEPTAGAWTGGIATHVVVRGDTLSALGARAGIDTATLAADNSLARNQPLVIGQRLTIDNRHLVVTRDIGAGAEIVVNLPQRMLFFVDGSVAGLPVAVGKRTWPTPIGGFRIAVRETDPTWDVPASIRAEAQALGRSLPRSVPPGPSNPLGQFWIGLAGAGFGVHGTNAPSSIYGAVTHGCVRLHPDDIAWLFSRVKVGMTVRFVYEPMLLVDVGGRVFLEVHPDVYRRAPVSIASVRTRAIELGLDGHIDWTQAARVVALQQGVARDVTAATTNGAEAGVAP
jgi:L,D-transpeptidase ErfK/SrfK